MAENPLQAIMNPGSIVIAGASNNMMKMGAIQAINQLDAGFKGEIVFLHPKESKILGRPAYSNPADLPFVPDLALLVTPTKVTPDLIDGLGERGVRSAVITTAGFKEVGERGKKLDAKLVAAAKHHNLRFVGPNCIGVLNSHIGLNLTVCPYTQKPGHLGLISQSGTYVAQTLPWLDYRGIRYSQAISIGNATDIDVVDALDHLGSDPNTKAIAMYVEGIARGREFIETARKVVRKKPVVALYVGGSEAGRRSGHSHTGSMGGPNELYDGIFRQAGVLRAGSLDEMFGWGHALASMPAPKGSRIAILTHSGGPATSMADAVEKAGMQVPEFSEKLQKEIQPFIESTASAKNPIDLTFSLAHEALTEKIPEIIFKSDEVDAVLTHGIMDTGFAMQLYPSFSKLMDIDKESFVSNLKFDLKPLQKTVRDSGKPLCGSTFIWADHAAEFFRDNNLPLFPTPEQAARAMAALWQYGKISKRQKKNDDFRARLPENQAPKLTAPESGILDEFQAKRLLAEIGIPVVEELLVNELEKASIAAKDIGYPVVLKGLPEGVAHKSEVGLVKLGITDDQSLKKAWEDIEKTAAGCPKLVARQVAGEREMVIGMTRQPGFGPCLMLGVGGLFTESIKDAVFYAAPVAIDEAASMIDSLRLRDMYGETRGKKGVDRELLGEIIVKLGEFALEHPEVEEIDINPLVIEDGKPVAVDALIVLDNSETK